jgi:hypothetical protein
MPTVSDETEQALFVIPKATLAVSQSASASGWRIRLLGNREGIASLASVLLWLHANAFRREFLSLTTLPFVHAESDLALTLRVRSDEGGDNFGVVRRLDPAAQFEWELTEDDLERLALRLYRLASVPEHEYELLDVGPTTGQAQIELRLSDA